MKLRISAAARNAAQRRFLDVFVTGQQFRQHIVEFAQGGRLHAVQGGDAQHHVVAQAVREMAEDFAGLVAFQVDQDGGDDLRVFVADQLGHGLRIHPLQRFDAGRILAARMRDSSTDALSSPAPWSAPGGCIRPNRDRRWS